MIKETEQVIAENHSQSPWWENQQLAVGEHCQFTLGDLQLSIKHSKYEWECRYHYNMNEALPILEKNLKEETILSPKKLERLAVQNTGDKFSIRPIVSDKPFVIRTSSPIHLPSGESAEVFMSSIIWLQISIGAEEIPWVSFPVEIPTETWMGVNTMEGDLCYTSRTAGRLDLSLLPERPYRAITAVKVINQGLETLLLDKINLPIPYLSIYVSAKGTFWTESVEIILGDSLSPAHLTIIEGAPSVVGHSKLVTSARETQLDNLFIKAANELFG